MRGAQPPGVWRGLSNPGDFVFLKILLGVQTHTSTLHVLAEFGRYFLKIAWKAQAAQCLSRLESMDDNRTLKQALLADRRLPKQKSRSLQLEAELHDVSVNIVLL